MCKFSLKSGDTRIDPCMRNLIKILNNKGFDTVASCCGHKKYTMTIIVRSNFGVAMDLMSGVQFPRLTRFYKRDKQGYYFIPEVVEYWKEKK